MQGDTWDIISWRVYGSSSAMDKLIYANWQHREVYMFRAGVVLEIPTLEVGSSSPNLPPWRR